MLVYFIFYDDYDLYNAENDHQNVIKLKTKSTSSVSFLEDDENSEKDRSDLCSLCLEEITILNEKVPASVSSKDNNIKDFFVFEDLTKYNYKNQEYTHTCGCCPTLHSKCLIRIYENQKSCLICRQPIYWRFSKIAEVKTKFFQIFVVSFYDRVCVFLSVGFCAYVMFVIICNI